MNTENLKVILQNHRSFLRGADNGKKADLSEADLRMADLSGADLRRANLRGADLRWANLREANLSMADLSGADLSGADLREADLRGADLRGADLRRANLRGADLREADLSEADLSGADLREASIKIYQAGRWTAVISGEAIAIGYKMHSVEKWRNFTDEEIADMHVDALEYWRENKAIVLAISQSFPSPMED